MTSYKDLIFIPTPRENAWTPVSAGHAIMNDPIEFILHNGNVHLGYRVEIQPIGRGLHPHSFGAKSMYVAENDGDDEFYPPHHVEKWRSSKPFPKERFLGVCDSSEEEHLGRLSAMFVNYFDLARRQCRTAGTSNVNVIMHQTRHFMAVDGVEYWQTLINVCKSGVTRTVTMHEIDLEDHVTFKQPEVENHSFKFNQLDEAVDFVMNSVFQTE